MVNLLLGKSWKNFGCFNNSLEFRPNFLQLHGDKDGQLTLGEFQKHFRYFNLCKRSRSILEVLELGCPAHKAHTDLEIMSVSFI